MTQAGKTKKIFDGRYEIIEIVGRGACSVVYHAKHATTPTTDVALKVLLNKKGEPPNTDRLRKEALAMVSSRHRYVIRLDDFHSVGDICYLSMEFAPGADLRQYLTRKGTKLSLPQAERFLLQACEAMGFIHRAGIIHRDIKPDNILVMNDNEIRLGDFGVSVLPGEESTLEELQRGVGTMDYMAPEVLEGIKYDQRSDVYALAVTFYEILAGKHPFASASIMEQLEIRKAGKLTPLSAVAPETPKYLSDVLMKAMSYDREARYATGRDMLQAILVGKSEAEIREKPKAPPVVEPPPGLKNKIEKSILREERSESAPGTEAPPSRTSVIPKPREMRQFSKRPEPRQEAEVRPADTEAPPAPPVKIQEPARKDTVTVTSKELGAAIEKSPKPTVVLTPEQRTNALASSALETSEATRAPTKTDIKAALETKSPATSGNNALAPQQNPPKRSKPKSMETQGGIFDKLKDAQAKAKEAWDKKNGGLQKLPQSNSKLDLIRDFIDNLDLSDQTKKLIIGGIVCFVLLLGYSIFGGSRPAEQTENENNSVETVAVQPSEGGDVLIPKVTAPDFTFPRLAPGMYVGKMEGLAPGQVVPFTIISLAGKDALAILIGAQGWSPIIVPFSNKSIKEAPTDPSPRLRVSSNGTILELTGQNIDGELLGYFSNLVTGDQGRWEASPVK